MAVGGFPPGLIGLRSFDPTRWHLPASWCTTDIAFKVDANEEALLQKHFKSMLLTMLYGWGNGTETKHFCFRDANSASSRYVSWVRKRRNIRETFKVSVSSVFPKWFLVCFLTQHMLKTQNLDQDPERQKLYTQSFWYSVVLVKRQDWPGLEFVIARSKYALVQAWS